MMEQFHLKDNERPIHLACKKGNYEIVKFLLDNKCDIESTNIYENRPIHLACYNGNFTIVRLLCEYKCDIEAYNKQGDRPIHIACANGFIDIVKILFQYNCDVGVHNKHDNTIIQLSTQNNHNDVFNLIKLEIKVHKFGRSLSNTILESNSADLDEILKSIILSINLDKLIPLGIGTFGKVYKWEDYKSDFKLKIKLIKFWDTSSNAKIVEGHINNYRILKNHPRIEHYFGATVLNENLFIFSEFLEATSLHHQIKKSGPIEPSIIIHYLKQILEGLIYLHQNQIIHRDIRPKNILVDINKNIKLCDFGLTYALAHLNTVKTIVYRSNGNDAFTLFCYPSNYMAPEIIAGEEYSFPVDIWSCGATTVEMLTGRPPYSEITNPIFLLFKIGLTRKIEINLLKPKSKFWLSFIEKCLSPNQLLRATATELLIFIKKNHMKT